MPTERTRMGCRRGSSTGRVLRQASSTTLDPSSEALDFGFNSYPATRSDLRRGREHFRTEVSSHHSSLHTACFRLPCNFGNSSFIVSVTVELSEHARDSGIVDSEVPQHQMENQNVSSPNVNSQRREIGGFAIQDSPTLAGPSTPVAEEPARKEGQSLDSEEPAHYRCRIIEEQPPTQHED